MAFALIAWSSSLSALSAVLRPLRRKPPAPAPAWTPHVPDEGHRLVLPDAAPARRADAARTSPSAEPAARPACAAPVARRVAQRRPLRVILRRQGDGDFRLVISGRMADVCAELDRLALS